MVTVQRGAPTQAPAVASGSAMEEEVAPGQVDPEQTQFWVGDDADSEDDDVSIVYAEGAGEGAEEPKPAGVAGGRRTGKGGRPPRALPRATPY